MVRVIFVSVPRGGFHKVSFSRFGWRSDVYVILDVKRFFPCYRWDPSADDFYKARTTDAMLEHLRGHRAAGELVPESCFERLEAERVENDAFIETGEWS